MKSETSERVRSWYFLYLFTIFFLKICLISKDIWAYQKNLVYSHESGELRYAQPIVATKATQELTHSGSYPVICRWFNFCNTDIKNQKWYWPCGYADSSAEKNHRNMLSSLSRTDPGLDSLSLSNRSSGSIAAMQGPAAAWTRGLNQAFLSYCLELLPRRQSQW